MKDITKIIKRPLITEKGTMLREGANQILLAVDPDANKIEIKRAVEEGCCHLEGWRQHRILRRGITDEYQGF